MPITPEVIVASDAAKNLRSERALRELRKDEDGWDVFKLPLDGGVYGFTYSPAQKEMPVYKEQRYHCFEVHRLKDGAVHMVGFVTPDTAAKIKARSATLEAILYPAPYEAATALVSLDVADMQPAKKAITREDGNPLKTLVFPE